jgi:exonuclease III
MRIAVWNMNHSRTHRTRAWKYLAEMGIDLALVQEALRPPDEFQSIFRTVGDRVRMYPWGSAIVALRKDLKLRERPRTPLADCYMRRLKNGEVPDSHPGSTAVADVVSADSRLLFTAVSVYAQWESAGSSSWYSCARFHRVVSDLTGVLARSRTTPVILAGDFNLSTQHDNTPESRMNAEAAAAALRRLRAWQLVDCLSSTRASRKRLTGCRCLDGVECSHVGTYRRKQSLTSDGRQLDYAFASQSIAASASCSLAADAWEMSDHCPIVLDVSL